MPAARLVFQIADRTGHSCDQCREYRLQPALIKTKQFSQADAFSAEADDLLTCCMTKELYVERAANKLCVVFYLEHQTAVAISEDILRLHRLKAETDTVAEAHLHHRFRDASDARCICGYRLTGCDHLRCLVPQSDQRVSPWKSPACAAAVFIRVRFEQNHPVAGFLEFR